MREEWLTNLLEQTNEVCDATRKEVSEWMAACYWELVGSRILRNSWRKTGYDWFPGLVDQDDMAGDNDNGGSVDDGWDDGSYDDSLFDNDEEEDESDNNNSEDEGDD